MSYSVGECKYCGQLVQVDEPYETMEEAKEAAFAFCDCAGARAERRTLDQINNATEKIREIFGQVGEKAGFQTSTDQNVLEMLFEAAELCARGYLAQVSVQMMDGSKGKISVTQKGEIVVAKSETRTWQTKI